MRLRAALTVALLATLAGCSAATSTTTGPGRPANSDAADVYPCNLVSTPEAAAAYGSAVLDPVLTQVDGNEICTFEAADGSGAASITLQPGAGDSWDITRNSYQSQYATFADLPGLGDAAFTTGQEVFVRHGNDVLKFAVVLPYHDKVAERSLSLATSANL